MNKNCDNYKNHFSCLKWKNKQQKKNKKKEGSIGGRGIVGL